MALRDLSDREQLEAWLRTQPREVSLGIASRGALRVFPVLAQLTRVTVGGESGASAIILPLLRGMVLPWAAAKYPAHGNVLRAAAAADAYAAAAAARAAAAAYAADARADADAYAATDAAHAARASRAADAAAAFTAVTADVDYIHSSSGNAATLAGLPLWPNGVTGGIAKLWKLRRSELLALGDDWDVWVHWYDAVLAGNPTPGGEELDLFRVLLNGEEDWKRGPAHVNALIKAKEAQIAMAAPYDSFVDSGSTGGRREQWDYFISYSTKDNSYAQWVGALLTGHGKSVFAQYNDMPPGTNFVRQMMDGLAGSRNFIALLSPDYEQSDQCQAEWSAAYNKDPSGRNRYIRPFKIRPVQLNKLASQVVYTDLCGLSEDEARQAVLQAIGLVAQPSAPPPPWPKAVAKQNLVETASPKAALTADQQIDAVANEIFDAAAPDEDLATLPARQQAVIKAIGTDLPANAPKSLCNALSGYSSELVKHGIRPILGILNDMADIIEAGVKAGNASAEWLDAAMAKAFERFLANHELFRTHFPLDSERESIYEKIQIDDEAAQGDALEEPFRRVAKSVDEAQKAGLPTAQFIEIIKTFKEFAEVVATQPMAPMSTADQTPKPPAVNDGREPDSIRGVSRKKRLILSAIGFFASSVGLIASSTQLMTTNWMALSQSLQVAIEQLMKFVFY